ncbi:cyclophilin type peptidyl-prolyl cis-trans isomerase/CLD family protein, partial [Vibrio parahaemolyticus VP2007-007]
TLS